MDERVETLLIYAADGARDRFEGKSIRLEAGTTTNVFLVEQSDGKTLRIETNMQFTLSKFVA